MRIHQLINIFIASIWIVNGLICKVLDVVPRHQEIVARILGDEHSRLLTLLIGLAEIVMAIWIFGGFKSKLNAVFQIVIISAMNVLEGILAPDLLLWGRANLVFAFGFILLIYYNTFYLQYGKQPNVA